MQDPGYFDKFHGLFILRTKYTQGGVVFQDTTTSQVIITQEFR